MDPLVITEIDAKPEVPISRNLPDEATLIPGVFAKVWDSTKPGDFSDATAPDGSQTPFGFLLDPKNKGIAQIKLTGTAIYPQEWQGLLNPVLVGYLDDSTQAPIISAKIGEVTLPSRQAPSPPLKFNVTQMDFAEPLDPKVAQQSPVPYRIAGDFRWKLTCPDKSFAPITTKVQTRLEFYWLRTYAASGPLKIQSSFSETMMDMQGKYPVSVLRYFLPSTADLKTGVNLAAHPSTWWANYVIAQKITGVKYNAIDGRAGYGVGCCGGSFNWHDWLLKVNPYVNSFDLAALIQAAMSLISTRNFFNYDFVLRWVCHTPDGFLQTSMPYGWAGSANPNTSAGVNNPFFLGLTSTSAVHLADPSTVPNCALNARAWLEIGPSDDIKGPYVLDTAFNVIPQGQTTYQPEIEQLTRAAFLKAHLVKADGGDADAMDNGTSNPKAACYSNEQFGSTQSGEPKVTTRVGLVNLFGANEPKFGPIPVPLMPMPACIRQPIAAAVTARKVAGARWMYNDASLKSKNIFPILKDTTAFTPGVSWVAIGKGVSVVTYLLGNVGLSGTTKGQICVKIHVYDNFYDSTEALAMELSKFESKLDVALRPAAASTVGNYYVRTRSSVLFVRGNLLVDICFAGTAAVDDPNYAAGVLMAARLDAHLAARQVMKTQVRRPSLALAAPAPVEVDGEIEVGGSFDVAMADPELLADECVARSSVGRVLLCSSGPVAGRAEKKFSFVALSLDVPKVAQRAEVTFVVAHPDTYHPGFRAFSVTVKPK